MIRMNFSTRTLLTVTAFFCVILGIVFLMPATLGLLLMTVLALTALPAFVQVGVFTTSGIRRSFFIGTAIGGMPHFIVNLYYTAMSIFNGPDVLGSLSWKMLFENDETF